MFSPTELSAMSRSSMWSRSRRMVRLVILRLRKLDRAPTFFEIDISLSLSTTIRFRPRSPAWLRPSKAMPAVIEPSPMTAMTLPGSSRIALAAAMPRL